MSEYALELARSTVCGWHEALAELAKPLIEAMWTDALTAPYLCTRPEARSAERRRRKAARYRNPRFTPAT